MTQAKITLAAQDKTGAAFASVRQRFAGLSADAGQVGRALSGIGVQFSAALFGAGLVALAKSTVDSLDKLNDLSDATGSSIENLSALEDVAARTGTSMDTVGTAVTKLNQMLADVKPGSGAAQALDALGLSAKDLKAIDPAEALQQVAVALSGFADDGNKARLVQELFGKSLRVVAPLLNDLAKSGALNATVTTAQARAAEAFNIELFKMQKSTADLGRALASDFLPVANEVFARLKVGTEVFGGFANLLKVGVSSRSFSDAADGIRVYADEVSRLQKTRAIVEARGGKDPFRGDLADIDEKITKAQKLETFYRRVFALTARDNGQTDPTELARRGRLDVKPSLPGVGGGDANAVKQAVSEYDKYLAKLQESILQTADLSAAEQARIDINKGLLGVLNEAQKSQIIGLAASLDSVKALQEAEKQAAAIAERGRSFSQRFATGQERQAALLQESDDLVAKGAISWSTYGRVATTALQDSIEELGKVAGSIPKLAAPFEQISVFSEEAARNIQDTLGETLEQVLAGNFRDIGKLWASTLQKMVAQAAAAQLNSYLFGDTFGTKGGSLGGIVGRLFSGTLFGGARAEGGPVSAGRAYLVGERGPEIVVPRGAGTVLPNGVGMGGSVTINQTINVGQGVSRGEVYAAAMQAKEAAKAEIMQTLYRTGRGAYA